jgi:hypothetical protein
MARIPALRKVRPSKHAAILKVQLTVWIVS